MILGVSGDIYTQYMLLDLVTELREKKPFPKKVLP